MYSRGVRASGGLAVGQVHLQRELAATIIDAANRCYPGETNGSLRGAIEIIIQDFLEIPSALSPDDMDLLIRRTESRSLCEALGKIAETWLKEKHETTS